MYMPVWPWKAFKVYFAAHPGARQWDQELFCSGVHSHRTAWNMGATVPDFSWCFAIPYQTGEKQAIRRSRGQRGGGMRGEPRVPLSQSDNRPREGRRVRGRRRPPPPPSLISLFCREAKQGPQQDERINKMRCKGHESSRRRSSCLGRDKKKKKKLSLLFPSTPLCLTPDG